MRKYILDIKTDCGDLTFYFLAETLGKSRKLNCLHLHNIDSDVSLWV